MKQTLVLCLLAAATAAVADTSYVVVGTPDRSNVVPFWGQTYDAFRLQWLYYASDIGQPGRIVSVGLRAASSATGPYNNVRLLLCHTNTNQLANDFAANYAGNTPVECFAADTVVGAPANEWFTLPADFQYDNAKNLIVEIRWRGDGGVSVPLYRREVQHDRRRLFAYDDSATSGFADTVPGNHIRFGFVTTSLAEPVLYVEPAAPSPAASVVRNVLYLPVSSFELRHSSFLLDASGRRILVLRPGTNDLSGLAPGVYFLRENASAPPRRVLLVR